tara:strand:- start:376 stop:543 length:168 start_codon:yes stop_codon:yes gene_type:complete
MYDVEERHQRIVFIKEEISILKSMLREQDTGRIQTAINVLEDRVVELKENECQKP